MLLIPTAPFHTVHHIRDDRIVNESVVDARNRPGSPLSSARCGNVVHRLFRLNSIREVNNPCPLCRSTRSDQTTV